MSKSVFDKVREKYLGVKSNRKKFFSHIKWLPDGRTIFRVLPKHELQELPFFVGGKHYLGKGKFPELCPAMCTAHKDVQLPCPIDEFVSDLWDSRDEENIALAKRIRGAQRFFWPVIIRKIIHADGRKEVPDSNVVTVLEVPEVVWTQMLGFFYQKSDVALDSPLDQMIDEDEIFDFTDPHNGRDITVSRGIGKGGRVEYTTSLDLENSRLAKTDAEIEEILSNNINLDEYIPSQCKSYAELEAVISGGTPVESVVEPEDDDDDDDEDNVPFNTTDDDDDDDELDQEDDDDEEPEPPKQEKKKKATNPALADLVRKQMNKRGAKD